MPLPLATPPQCAQTNPATTNQTPSGYILLLSVLVVGAVGVTIATALLLWSVAAANTSLSIQQSLQARALADSCADEAIWQLLQDNTYVGSTSLTIDSHTCTIAAVGGSGATNRTVQTTGTVGEVVRKVEVEIADLGPPVVITTWQEVADF